MGIAYDNRYHPSYPDDSFAPPDLFYRGFFFSLSSRQYSNLVRHTGYYAGRLYCHSYRIREYYFGITVYLYGVSFTGWILGVSHYLGILSFASIALPPVSW